MNRIKNCKTLLITAMALVCMLLFASCGESVNTELIIDKDFNGKRNISIYISNEDLEEYITDGSSAIDSVINAYKPESVTYTKNTGDEGITYTFSTAFSGLNDYKTKVNEALAANPDNTCEPQIEYSCSDSPFAQEVYFSENFTSLDLIGWFIYGLQTEDIVNTTYSTDNWFELDDNVIVFNSQEYSSRNTLSIDDSVYNSPKEIVSKTYFNNDGSISRYFEFSFGKSEIEVLTENGIDLQGYFQSLCSGGTVSRIDNENGAKTFIVFLPGTDSETISAQTAALLFDENASLHINTSAVDKAAEGKDYDVQIDVMEQMNAVYYLGNKYDNFSSRYYFPDGVKQISEEIPTGEQYYTPNLRVGREELSEDQIVSYYSYVCPSKTDTIISCFSMGWSLNFEQMEIELSISSDTPSLAVELGIPAQASSIIQDAVKNNLANAIPDGADFTDSLSDDSSLMILRIDFGKGDTEAVSNRYKTFIYNYTGEKVMCDFASSEIETGSPFKSMKSYSMLIDFRPISGNDDITMSYLPSIGEDVTILSNSTFKTDTESSSDSEYRGITYGYVEFYAVCRQVNVLGIIAIAALAVGIILLVLVITANRSSISAGLGRMKASAAKATEKSDIIKDKVAAVSAELKEYQQFNAQKTENNNDAANASNDDEEEEEFI